MYSIYEVCPLPHVSVFSSAIDWGLDYQLDSRDPPPPRVVINSRRHEMGAGEVVPELHGNKRESARRTRRWTARLGAWMS